MVRLDNYNSCKIIRPNRMALFMCVWCSKVFPKKPKKRKITYLHHMLANNINKILIFCYEVLYGVNYNQTIVYFII